MKKITLSILIFTIATFTTATQASEFDISKGKLEGGAHLSLFDMDNISSIIGLSGYLGYKIDFKPQLSVIPEARLGTGLISGKLENTQHTSLEYNISYFFSTGAKVQYEIDPKLYVNGGLNLNKYKYKFKFNSGYFKGISGAHTSSLKLGLSLGGGYKLSDTLAVDGRLDFVDGLNTYSIGAVMAF